MARLGRGQPVPAVIKRAPRNVDAIVNLGDFRATASFPALSVVTPDAHVFLGDFRATASFPSTGLAASLPDFRISATFPALSVVVPVLPGQYITEDGQVEWGGVLWGPGTSYRVQEITGWETPSQLDDLSVEEPSRHGAYAGSSFAQKRVVTVHLMLESFSDPTQIHSLIRQLRYDTRVLRDNTLWSLVVRGYTETLLGFGKIGDRPIVMGADYSVGAAEVGLVFILPDPRRYSLQQQSTVITAAGSGTLVNDGDCYTNPILRFSGPASGLVLTNATLSRTLAFNLTLSDGQRLDVDTQRGTAVVGTVKHTRDLASGASVPIKEFFLDVGSNSLTYATTTGGANGVEILWRAASL